MKKLMFTTAFLITGLSAPIVFAGSNSPPSPYTGGAAVEKVLYPPDGSTVTITSTGAVIKQSPNQTAYREGWINTADICSINASSDLNGKLRPGSTNPYGSSSTTTKCNTTTGSPSPTSTQSVPTNVSSSANASSSAQIITTGSQPTLQAPVPQNNYPTPLAPTAAPVTQTPETKATALPNTGPGEVVSVFGVSTILGTIGHYLVARRKNLTS